MARRRAPWWVYGIALSVLGYLTLMAYAEMCGPGAIGADLRFERGRAVVVAVFPGYPAARAGIREGDSIERAGGEPVPTVLAWRGAFDQAEVGRPFRLEVERDSRRFPASLWFDAHWRRWTPGIWLTFLAKVTAQLVAFALALLIAFSRPRNPVALVGALWLASMAITDLAPVAVYDPHAPTWPYGTAALWRSLPPWLSAPLWIGTATFVLGPALNLLFFALFPRPLFRTRRVRLLLWLGWGVIAAASLIPLLALSYYEIYLARQGPLPDWFSTYTGVGVVSVIGLAMAFLVVNYRRLVDRNERRRVRVLVLGALIGVMGPSATAMASFFNLPSGLQSALRTPVGGVGSTLLFLVFPLSFAYAVLRHQLFDVRVMVRQGLQYALARRLVLALVPACGAILLVDVLAHGDQPLWAVVRSRAWMYGVVAGLAWAAHARQQRWLEALDRRFFREGYHAQRLLREVAEEIRGAANVDAIAARVVGRIEAALHPEFVALLARSGREDEYRARASAPALEGGLALPPDSKLAALARLLGKPIAVGADAAGSLAEQLPQAEIELLRRTRIALIVPVPGSLDRLDALLALGPKRSEEPFARDDQELLVAVAASLGLLADRAGPVGAPEAFEECPRCGICYDPGSRRCPRDGATLDVTSLPRRLAGRYRLERRLGRGGMGTVYEATDTALERAVAVKVIREDLVASADIADRFRGEARVAASFSHPNVVTVHDFGVTAEMRAYLVMELLRGMTLRDALGVDGRLAPARALAILDDACAAVEAAHGRQLVHRDLKPENVFLVGDGPRERAKVLDFGLAKLLAAGDAAETAAATATGVVVGTWRYMAPEQLSGAVAAPSWDVWALAVMAYEMVTGALPFEGNTPVDYQVAVLGGRLTPVSAHRPDTAGRLQAFFARSLAVDPARRPARAPNLVAEFRRALE